MVSSRAPAARPRKCHGLRSPYGCSPAGLHRAAAVEPADSREEAHRALQAVNEPEAESLKDILRYLRATPLKGDHADRLQFCEVFQRLLTEDVEEFRSSHEPNGLLEEYTRLTHNDLCGNNLLVEDGRLVGVVDWESAMVGVTDKDCEEYGELAGTEDDADCGSGLPVAPGASQRRRFMRIIGGVKCLYHSNASWYSWCDSPELRVAMDLRVRPQANGRQTPTHLD